MKLRRKSHRPMREVKPKADEYMTDGPVGPSKSKKEPTKIYPRLTLAHEFFPEAKKWEVGKEYTIELKIKMTGLSISKFQNDSEFEIRGFESEDTEEDPVIPKPLKTK